MDLPARFMWGWGHTGFCGSMSIQTMNLYYGNYVSQGLVRASVGNKEIIPAQNMEKAMSILKMRFEPWDYTQKAPHYKQYWEWTKYSIKQGIPVIGTVYEKTTKVMRYPQFDHIVPFIGFSESSEN